MILLLLLRFPDPTLGLFFSSTDCVYACLQFRRLQLAGFFAVEDSVLRSGNELLSRSEVKHAGLFVHGVRGTGE